VQRERTFSICYREAAAPAKNEFPLAFMLSRYMALWQEQPIKVIMCHSIDEIWTPKRTIMKAIIYCQILFSTFLLLACSSNSVDKLHDESISLKFGQQQSVSYLGKNYDLLVYDVNTVFSEGVYSEDKTGSLYNLYDIGLIINQDSVTIRSFTYVYQTGKRSSLSFETLSQYPASFNYVKTIGSLQIAVSEVYQEPEKEFINTNDYKVKLLLK